MLGRGAGAARGEPRAAATIATRREGAREHAERPRQGDRRRRGTDPPEVTRPAGPVRRSQSFYRRYGSVLPNSLARLIPSGQRLLTSET